MTEIKLNCLFYNLSVRRCIFPLTCLLSDFTHEIFCLVSSCFCQGFCDGDTVWTRQRGEECGLSDTRCSGQGREKLFFIVCVQGVMFMINHSLDESCRNVHQRYFLVMKQESCNFTGMELTQFCAPHSSMYLRAAVDITHPQTVAAICLNPLPVQYSGYWYMIRTLHMRSRCCNARLDRFYPTECILSDLICVSPQCPIDARKVLSENLVVIGGTAMLPGFLHRLLAEIRLLVERPKYSSVLASKTLRIHAPPAKPNCTAWLGGQRWDFV